MSEVRRRILVVDDERAIRNAVERLLRRDFDVTLAGGVDEALAAIAKAPFDIVLCDLLMPEKTGMDLYDHLRATQPRQADRVLFMTGSTHDPRISAFRANHPERPFLEKPFRKQALVEAIARIT